MDQKLNGHDGTAGDAQEAIADIKQLASRIVDPKPATVIEAVPLTPGVTPFEQAAHDLIVESIDRIAQDWKNELKAVRDNTMMLEQLIKDASDKAKDDITRMHLLGAQVMKEAERAHNVCNQLADGLDQILESRPS